MLAKGVATVWFKNLNDPKSQEEFKKLVLSSVVLKRLKDILKEKEFTEQRQETTQEDYDSPSWAYKQADRNGFRRCLKSIQELLNHIEE